MSTAQKLIRAADSPLQVQLPDGKQIQAASVVDLCLNIDNIIYDTSAYVLDIEEALILGSDFF